MRPAATSASTTARPSTSSIHDIGESPLNGSQHGVGVLYTTVDQAGNTTGPTATGTLRGTTITDYQKNGVVVSGTGAKATVKNNTVTGQGRIDWIAQNGIQISFGATGTVTGNSVSRNFYTPKAYTACGLLFYQAAGNEVNICNAGRGKGNVAEFRKRPRTSSHRGAPSRAPLVRQRRRRKSTSATWPQAA